MPERAVIGVDELLAMRDDRRPAVPNASDTIRASFTRLGSVTARFV